MGDDGQKERKERCKQLIILILFIFGYYVLKNVKDYM